MGKEEPRVSYFATPATMQAGKCTMGYERANDSKFPSLSKPKRPYMHLSAYHRSELATWRRSSEAVEA